MPDALLLLALVALLEIAWALRAIGRDAEHG
jgi:hypothetical protein